MQEWKSTVLIVQLSESFSSLKKKWVHVLTEDWDRSCKRLVMKSVLYYETSEDISTHTQVTGKIVH